MDQDHDTALYAVDVDDPILVEINRKLGSVPHVVETDDVQLSRPVFSASLDVDPEEL